MDLLFASPFFDGSVKEAVEKALSQSLMLCVVVVERGSTADQLVWQDAQLAEKMRRETVALRVEVGSEEQQQFSAIYGPVAGLPSMYLVGASGTLLKVVNHIESSTQVLQALQAVDSKAVEAMKQKLEVMRAQKQAAEQRNETESEIQRREQQKALAEAKRLAEARARDADAERTRKARDESAKHRDEVVAKIRAEREERTKRAASASALAPTEPALPSNAPEVISPVVSVADRARLRFQITGADGQADTLTHDFAAHDTFAAVRQFLASRGHTAVSIESVHPRRSFSAANDAQTLADLRLVPSCTLIVAPTARSSSVMRAIGGVLQGRGGGGGGAAPAAARAAPHPHVDPNYVHPVDHTTFVDAIWNGCVSLYRMVTRPCRGPRSSSSAAAAAAAPGQSAGAQAAQRRRGPYVEVPTDPSKPAPDSNVYFDSGSGTFTVPRNEDEL